jgi:hypothetical protein
MPEVRAAATKMLDVQIEQRFFVKMFFNVWSLPNGRLYAPALCGLAYGIRPPITSVSRKSAVLSETILDQLRLSTILLDG